MTNQQIAFDPGKNDMFVVGGKLTFDKPLVKKI